MADWRKKWVQGWGNKWKEGRMVPLLLVRYDWAESQKWFILLKILNQLTLCWDEWDWLNWVEFIDKDRLEEEPFCKAFEGGDCVCKMQQESLSKGLFFFFSHFHFNISKPMMLIYLIYLGWFHWKVFRLLKWAELIFTKYPLWKRHRKLH